MNTKIYYLYRDAKNYKNQNKAIVEGEYTEEDVQTIISCCEPGDENWYYYFVPEQVGLDCERFSNWRPEDDHYFCEITDDAFELVDELPNTYVDGDDGKLRPMTIDELVKRFVEVAETGGWWDIDPEDM